MLSRLMTFMLAVLFCTVNASAQPTWQVDLHIEAPGIAQVLSFGGSSTGTDSFDVGLDVLAPPEPPESYYTYFLINDSDFQNLNRDVRHWESPYEDDIDWTFIVTNAEGVATTISWEPSTLPTEGTFQINWANHTNMQVEDSIAFDGNDTLFIQYRSEITQDIPVQNGMLNLISLNVTPTAPDAPDVFDGLVNFVVAFDAVSYTHLRAHET